MFRFFCGLSAAWAAVQAGAKHNKLLLLCIQFKSPAFRVRRRGNFSSFFEGQYGIGESLFVIASRWRAP